MKKQDIIRAWRDEDYRLSLSPEELAQMPANPAGFVELTEDDLRSKQVAGAGTMIPGFCAYDTCS